MRLLQISLRSFLLYSLILALISMPISFYTIQLMLNEEVDEMLLIHRNEFLQHIKGFEYLDDLEVDLGVLDQLSYDESVKPAASLLQTESIRTVFYFDSVEQEQRPFRELVSGVVIKNKPYTLTIRESLVESNELAMAIGLVQSLVIALLVFGLVIINRRLSGKLWTPFYSTLSKLKQFELDKSLPFESEETKVEEFNDLNKAIQNLTRKSKEVYQQQKEFTENASHEMQTPLAILQSRLDMLMQSPELTESQASIVQEIVSTSQRMARLNRNLLLLNKLDNNQFTENESVDVAAIIRSLSENLKPLADNQGIHIIQETASEHVMGNKTLIEILVGNLLSNALRYCQANGEVNVAWSNRKLLVRNSGIPLTVPVEKLFERFSKANAHPQSLGLGLAIIKKICDSNGYKLEYDFRNSQHQFLVTF